MARVSGEVVIKRTQASGAVDFIPVFLESEDADTAIVIETRAFDLAEFAGEEVVKRLQGISFEMDPLLPESFFFQYAALENPNETPNYSALVPISPGRIFHLNSRSPFHRVKLLDLLPRVRWQINGINLYGTWGKGRRRDAS